MSDKPEQEQPAIFDLASFNFGFFFQSHPIPPVLFEIVALLAAIAADEDWKTFQETGIHPTLGEIGKEGAHG